MKETTPLFVYLYVTNLHFIPQLNCCFCRFPQYRQLFSSNEMDRRLNRIRSHMEQEGIDACVFTSYYNVYYFSDFLYCSMGRQYCLIVTDETTITITPCKYVPIEGWLEEKFRVFLFPSFLFFNPSIIPSVPSIQQSVSLESLLIRSNKSVCWIFSKYKVRRSMTSELCRSRRDLSNSWADTTSSPRRFGCRPFLLR